MVFGCCFFLDAKLSKKIGISKFILIFLLGGSKELADSLKILGVFKADKPCVGVSVKECEEVAEAVAVGVVAVLIDFVDDFATAFNDDSSDSAVVPQVVGFLGVVKNSFFHILSFLDTKISIMSDISKFICENFTPVGSLNERGLTIA